MIMLDTQSGKQKESNLPISGANKADELAQTTVALRALLHTVKRRWIRHESMSVSLPRKFLNTVDEVNVS